MRDQIDFALPHVHCHLFIGFELFVPCHLFPHAWATLSRRSVTPVTSSVQVSSQSFTHASEEYSLSSSHTSNPHTTSSSPPGSNGRLPALIDRTSTSAPIELLEAPPVFADSCGGQISSRRARFVATVLPSFGAAASGSGLANSARLIKLSSETFRVCRIFFHSGGDPGSALLRVWVADHQSTPCSPTSLQTRTPSSS